MSPFFFFFSLTCLVASRCPVALLGDTSLIQIGGTAASVATAVLAVAIGALAQAVTRFFADAFVERHLWDLPELLTPHGRYPLEYNDGVANPALEDGFQRASREPNDERALETNSSDDDGFRKVRKPSGTFWKAKSRADNRSAGQIYARACDVLALLCEAVGLGVPSRVKIRRGLAASLPCWSGLI